MFSVGQRVVIRYSHHGLPAQAGEVLEIIDSALVSVLLDEPAYRWPWTKGGRTVIDAYHLEAEAN